MTTTFAHINILVADMDATIAFYRLVGLDVIAAEINGRPHKTLEFMTPSEKFAEAVAATP